LSEKSVGLPFEKVYLSAGHTVFENLSLCQVTTADGVRFAEQTQRSAFLRKISDSRISWWLFSKAHRCRAKHQPMMQHRHAVRTCARRCVTKTQQSKR